LDLGVEWNVIKKAGNSYTFGEEKLGVGRENAKLTLRQRPDLMKIIREAVIEAWKIKESEGALQTSPSPEDKDGDEETTE